MSEPRWAVYVPPQLLGNGTAIAGRVACPFGHHVPRKQLVPINQHCLVRCDALEREPHPPASGALRQMRLRGDCPVWLWLYTYPGMGALVVAVNVSEKDEIGRRSMNVSEVMAYLDIRRVTLAA